MANVNDRGCGSQTQSGLHSSVEFKDIASTYQVPQPTEPSTSPNGCHSEAVLLFSGFK